MSMESCLICHASHVESYLMGTDGQQKVYNCSNCGCFNIPRYKVSLAECAIKGDALMAHKCAAVMLERNLKGQNDNVQLDYVPQKGLVIVNTGEPVVSLYPTSFYDKLERGFFNIVRSYRGSLFRRFNLESLRYPLHALLFIEEKYVAAEEAANYMCKEGWLEDATCTLDKQTLKPTQGVGVEEPTKRYRITSGGMRCFEGVAKNLSNAFLAMWFGADDDRMYREAVQKAVTGAGYHLHVVDTEHYNGFIMDKVINLLNDSAFVIADITTAPEIICDGDVHNGVRGGVYWEAGYAAGQKKQVILTCRDDDDTTKRIHFDLQQYNQIRWRKDEGGVVTVNGQDFADALVQRILVTVGSGSFRAYGK